MDMTTAISQHNIW